jgi:hypothetical protein
VCSIFPAPFLCTDVAFAVDDFDIANFMSYGCYPNLQVLSLQTSLDLDTATSLTDVLSNITVPHLRQISLHLTFHTNGLVENVLWTDWMGVDRVLNSEKLGSLRSVKVLLEMVELSTRIEDLAHQSFIDQFPLLAARGLLDVTVINTECDYCRGQVP